MLQEGIIDKNVKFTPVLDNLRMPDYIDWELRPFTNHTVSRDACWCSCCDEVKLSPSLEAWLDYPSMKQRLPPIVN